MKPFKLYTEKSFPTFSLSSPLAKAGSQKYLPFYPTEEIDTEIRLTKPDFIQDVDRFSIKSGLLRNTKGYINYPIDDRIQKIEFDRYVHPIEVDAFHDKVRRLFAIQASKKECKGISSNLERGRLGIDLEEIFVDIDKICQICPRFKSVSFRNMTTYLRSMSVYGDYLNKDSLYNQLQKLGEKSSVVVIWPYKSSEHPIMITENGSVILVNDYRKSPSIELPLVLDVFDSLLKPSVVATKPDQDDPLDPTHDYVSKPPKKSRKKKRSDTVEHQ